MWSDEVVRVLEQQGAILRKTHVVLKSGRHSDMYVNKDAIIPDALLLNQLVAQMVERFVDLKPEIVAAPAVAGVALSQWGAYHLGRLTGAPVLAVYADKEGEGFAFKRGYDQRIADKRALVIEDVVTTGNSASLVIAAARALGAEVVGLSVMVNRGGLTAETFGVQRFHALCDLPLETWAEADCPLCAQDVPVNTSVGHGAAFLARRAAQPAPHCGPRCG